MERQTLAYARAFPDLAKEFQQVMRGELPADGIRDIPIFPADAKGLATRVAAGKVMNAVAPSIAGIDRRFGGFESIDLYRPFGTAETSSLAE